MVETELAVIGAGPAGLAAAVTAARAGVSTALLDELPWPGGQYLVRPADASPASLAGQVHGGWERRGYALLDGLGRSGVKLRLGTLVWSLSSDLRLALHDPHGIEHLQARAVLVAAGARESVVPFPGWTLPGVMTVGAAQLMAKKHGVLPGRRVLLAGSGPLLLAAACQLADRGAHVVGVVEATRFGAWLRHAPAAWGNWDRLEEGARYVSRLRRAGIPYRFGRTAMRAIGGECLEAVEIALLDGQGWPIPGSGEIVEADTLCLGFALVPNVELTQLAGCVHRFDPTRGGWAPVVNDRLETSVPGLFAAGETAGVGGAGAAIVEGEMAGWQIACRLGYIREDELDRRLPALIRADRRLRRFGTMLNTLFVAPIALDAITTDDTPICRCEEVLAGEVRAAVRRGAITLDALKTWTCAGQGPCQGRTCGPVLARLIARQATQSLASAGQFSVRPPLKPVCLGELAEGASQ